MNRLGRLLFLLSLSLLAACASQSVISDDIDVVVEFEDVIDLQGVAEVVIRCYCPKRNLRQEPSHPEATIRVTGRLNSQGFHGEQSESKAREFLRSRLTFSRRIEGQTLYLELSPDMGSFMHHSWGLSELWVRVPSDRRLRVEPLPIPIVELH